MTDGLTLIPGAGQVVPGTGMVLKVGDAHAAAWSVFDVQVAPGFDVGAHLHHHAQEFFYIIDGELDLLAFHPREPADRAGSDWREWESAEGARVLRGGPGASMYVPAGCPHAFANPGTTPTHMLFLVSPPGHEHYQAEIGKLLRGGGTPDAAAVAEIRVRHDIQQLTPMTIRQV